MTRQVLLYDGLCGFCNATVQFILDHESRQTLLFAPLQGSFAAGLIERHPQLKAIDSLIWVEGEGAEERVEVRSGAALAAARYMGRMWRLLTVLRIIPRPIRDFGYDQFARRRFKLFGRYGSCPVPSKTVQARFLA